MQFGLREKNSVTPTDPRQARKLYGGALAVKRLFRSQRGGTSRFWRGI